MTTRPGAWRSAALLGLSAVWLLLLCAPVLAHARLVEAYPAEEEILAGSPEQVRLRFSEHVEAAFDPIKVYDEGGERVDEDDARVDPDDARALIVGIGELAGGSYAVEWRITSTDGHVIDGTYGFSVTGSNESPSAAQAVNGDDIEEPASPEDEEGGAVHGIHVAVLGIGALVVLVMALLRRR